MQPKKLTTVLPAALNQIRPSATFLHVRGYTNNYDELSHFGIVFHANYRRAIERAIEVWRAYKPQNDLEKDAKLSLLTSYTDSLSGPNWRAKSAHAYRPITDGRELISGIKWHDNGKAAHLWGFEVQKTILRPGNYPLDARYAFTIARDKLMRMTKLSRFRQFKLMDYKFESISVDKLTFTHLDLLRELTP